MTPFKTSERKPTEADALNGCVHVWSGLMWNVCGFESVRDNPKVYPLWLPQPPAPVSEEDEAFLAAMKKQGIAFEQGRAK